MSTTRISILGAGPAGTTTAIFLARQGIPVRLIDKSAFPRDKVCGDCLGGYALSVLHQINPDLPEKILRTGRVFEGQGVHFFGPGHQKISIPATKLVNQSIKEVALGKRIDLDAMLLEEALSTGLVDFLPNLVISRIRKAEDRIILHDERKDRVLETGMLVVATGSHHGPVRMLTGESFNYREQATGLRAYFKNVKDLTPPGYIELHFLKELVPGYLWIFPLPDNRANVGLGLRTDRMKRKKIDLRKAFYKILSEDPYFRSRFALADQEGELQGFPLALSMRKHAISGDRYLLAGDAAHLIEPLFGEGIGHAMYSGKFAAEHVSQCLKRGDFSSEHNKKYDEKVYRKLDATFRFSRVMHRLAFYPSLMNLVFNRVEKNQRLQDMLFGVINGNIKKTPWNGVRIISRFMTGY